MLGCLSGPVRFGRMGNLNPLVLSSYIILLLECGGLNGVLFNITSSIGVLICRHVVGIEYVTLGGKYVH